MSSRGVEVTVLEDGRYSFPGPSGVNSISLENVSKKFERDRDPEQIRTFYSILAVPDIPSWAEAARGLHFAVEPADHDFGDSIHVPISDSVSRVLVYLNDDVGLAGTGRLFIRPGHPSGGGNGAPANANDRTASASRAKKRMIESSAGA
jgi:hypothetical protein